MTESPGVSLLGAASVFVVTDVTNSLAYYRDVLGFHVEFTYGEPMFYVGIERGGVIIHLQAAADTERQSGQGAVYIFVRGVDALYEEYKKSGAIILEEPKNYPWETREMLVGDLDNHRFRMSGSPK